MPDPYSDIVQEHFEHPRNVGVIEHADADAEVDNPACGDTMHLYLRIADDRIVEAKFQTQGCPAAIAAGSVLTELLVGKTVDEALDVKEALIHQTLGGLPPQKAHSAVLSEDAVKAAIAQYRRRQ
jgi:nitrogen fixation NifU-like protein